MFNKESSPHNIQIKNKPFERKMSSFKEHINGLDKRKWWTRNNSNEFNMMKHGAQNLYERIYNIEIPKKHMGSYANEVTRYGEYVKKLCIEYLEAKEGKYHEKLTLTDIGFKRQDLATQIYYDSDSILGDVEKLKRLNPSSNDESDETSVKIGDLILAIDPSQKLPAKSKTEYSGPKSLKGFKTPKTRFSRFLNPRIRSKVEDLLREAIKSNDFCMETPSESSVIRSIALEHFKNQFEPGVSRQKFDSDKRIDASRGQFNWNKGMSYKNLEKYGYLSNADERGTGIYGDVKFKFKKQHLFNRTTFTVGDSLANWGIIRSCKVSDPKIEAIQGVSKGNMEKVTNLYDKIINEPNITKFLIKNPSKIDPQQYYIELQYHGKLTFNDVEQVTLLKKLDKDETEVIKRVCKDKNIPVIEK